MLKATAAIEFPKLSNEKHVYYRIEVWIAIPAITGIAMDQSERSGSRNSFRRDSFCSATIVLSQHL